MSDVLVLSPYWEPINQVTWERAISLAYSGLVEVLETYDDWTVRSPSVVLTVPAVIRFFKGATGRRKGIRFSRENVYARDKGRCQYCGKKLDRTEATYDHVLPRVMGGVTNWTNVVICCVPCNQHKAGRTPEKARMWLRTKPVKPSSLPGAPLRLKLPKGRMPEQWNDYLRSVAYWTVPLNEDG